MIYAVIDLGTNTFNLLIAEVKGKSFRKIFGTKAVVKLGEGGITDNFIDETPFLRGIEALSEHRRTIEKYKADKIFAFATSAIRDARNGEKFSEVALKKTGIKINIISGEKEAELICLGVRQALKLGKEKCLLMDIGGGSTEFIIADSKKNFWKHSFQLGVSRLLEKFRPGDPIKKSDIEILEDFFSEELQPLFSAIEKFPARTLVGSSGSFDSFADMIAHKFYSKKILKGRTSYDFSLDDLLSIHKSIVKSTLPERMQMKGLVRFRADNIVLASIFTQFIIRSSGIEKVKLSKYALKEGVLWAILNNKRI